MKVWLVIEVDEEAATVHGVYSEAGKAKEVFKETLRNFLDPNDKADEVEWQNAIGDDRFVSDEGAELRIESHEVDGGADI